MNGELIAAIERLREAGKRNWHCGSEWDTWENCPKHPEGCSDPDTPEGICTCGADKHNELVDAAAEAALAEARKLVPKYDCAKCGRDACPHSGRYPKRPGPPDGCSSFKETP